MKIFRSFYLVCFNIFISASLILSPVAYSKESGGEGSGGGESGGGSSGGGESGGGSSGSSGGSGVILPGSNMGKVTENVGVNEGGGRIHSVDFSQPANPGKGQGGGGKSGKGQGGGGKSGSSSGSHRHFFGGNVDPDRNTGHSSSSQNSAASRRARQRAQKQEEERRKAAYKAQVQKQIKEFQALAKESPGTAGGGKRKHNKKISQTIEKAVYKSQIQREITSATAEIQQTLDSSSLSLEEKIKTAENEIQDIESRIHRMMQEPDMDMSYPEETKKAITKKDTRKMIQYLEEQVYGKILNQAKEDLESVKTNLEKNIQSLSQGIEESLDNPSDIEGIQVSEAFFEDQSPVHEILKAKYDRSELEVLEEEGLTRPEEEPYEFLSPEGEFLDKNRAVYEKLREANPFHEQGILAREVGLSAVEVADEEFANGNEPGAEMAFQTAEVMSDIVLGILPYVGTGKDAYELVTGKHLLSGRTLTLFERAMSGVGLILASLSGGTLSSGAVRLSLQKTSTITGQISSKLSKNFSKKLIPLETIKEYQEVFFQSVDAIGIKTKTGAESALKFATRAFSRETPPAAEITRVIHSVGKEGIENYARVLDELSLQLKKERLQLPELGETFLARQIRFKSEIFNQTQKIVNRDNLIKMGTTYAQKYYAFARRTPERVFRDSVWRGGSKKYILTKKQLFKFHKGMDSHVGRYTVGEKALYTSLKEETAIKEIMSKTELSTPDQVRQAYLIGQSKHIEIDKVLDLTNPNVLKQLDILDVNDIIKDIKKHTNAYDTTQVIGHIARSKRFKGIIAPSAPDKANKGINFISFKELE